MSAVSRVPRNSRAVAAEIIGRWLDEGLFPDRLTEAVEADRGFVTEVVHGAVKQRRTLEWVIRRCAEGRPDAALTPFLFVGLYQILMMDSVPAYAAVGETVQAFKEARGRRAGRAAGYLNAVLRRVSREVGAIRAELARQKPGIQTSHPDELITRWGQVWGAEDLARLLEWNNSRPDLVLHVNERRNKIGELVARFREAGIESEPHPFAPDVFLRVARGHAVPDLPGYAEGEFSVQDPSTAISVMLLNPQPGDVVLDACAAPGGKTLLMAERMGDNGRIVAVDLHADRLPMLEANLRRMGVSNARVVQADASKPEVLERLAENRGFDRILLDVPCTNTGVLRRRPDARWRFSKARLASLAVAQQALLDNAMRFLRPGGRLVYSTCSLEPEENGVLVHAWLEANPHYGLINSRLVVPGAQQTDGAYAALLARQ